MRKKKQYGCVLSHLQFVCHDYIRAVSQVLPDILYDLAMEELRITPGLQTLSIEFQVGSGFVVRVPRGENGDIGNGLSTPADYVLQYQTPQELVFKCASTEKLDEVCK
eukprot:gb/GECG01000744.1/.p1 GENE.gb/GECG01000744.1/~~gb/GECG01000744.1/.p1  ORF type:complete len:108 (+),score=12.15 gb/GECG01000744.1/:1-324(+)